MDEVTLIRIAMLALWAFMLTIFMKKKSFHFKAIALLYMLTAIWGLVSNNTTHVFFLAFISQIIIAKVLLDVSIEEHKYKGRSLAAVVTSHGRRG